MNKSEGKCGSYLFILPICRVLSKLHHNLVLSFTFVNALIRPWTQKGILEGVRGKSLKNLTNFSNTHERICVKDATPLLKFQIIQARIVNTKARYIRA